MGKPKALAIWMLVKKLLFEAADPLLYPRSFCTCILYERNSRFIVSSVALAIAFSMVTSYFLSQLLYLSLPIG